MCVRVRGHSFFYSTWLHMGKMEDQTRHEFGNSRAKGTEEALQRAPRPPHVFERFIGKSVGPNGVISHSGLHAFQ